MALALVDIGGTGGWWTMTRSGQGGLEGRGSDGDFPLRLLRELRVAELAEAEDEDVLPGAAGVEEPQAVAAPSAVFVCFPVFMRVAVYGLPFYHNGSGGANILKG